MKKLLGVKNHYLMIRFYPNKENRFIVGFKFCKAVFFPLTLTVYFGKYEFWIGFSRVFVRRIKWVF